MIYKIIRQDKESDDITVQSFNCYDEAYDLLEEIYSDVCCSDADYGDRPYYCLLYTSPSPRDRTRSRMPSSA